METNRIELNHDRIYQLTAKMHDSIKSKFDGKSYRHFVNVYPVPRGGIPVAYLLKAFQPSFYIIIDKLADAHIVVDDIIDSGETKERIIMKNQALRTRETIPFFALIDKRKSNDPFHKKWVIFPWEENTVGSIVEVPLRILQYLNEDTNRAGLKGTPERVVKSWSEIFCGYSMDPKSFIKVFPNEEKIDEMIVLKNIEFYSTCEHHMLPFYGKIHVGYLPNEKIIGVSKIPRIIEVYSRRLQIQERLTKQIADCIQEMITPLGVAVYCEAVHMCMLARGVKKQNAIMETSALTENFRRPEVRAEWFNLIKG